MPITSASPYWSSTALSAPANPGPSTSVSTAGRANIGLGKYPSVSLSTARAMARANALAASDKRPLPHDGIMGRNAVQDITIPTFAQVAQRTIAAQRNTEKTERNWRSALDKHVLPKLGSKRIDTITQRDVISIVLPLWGRKVGSNVRTYISKILEFAVSNEWRTGNPAGDAINGALVSGKVSTEHHASLHHSAVKGALAKVRAIETSGWLGMTLCLEFLVHTVVRHETALGARWNEIDLDRALWIIPASRMKAGREHVVPLTGQAIEILAKARKLGSGEYVFVGITGERSPDGSLRRVTSAAKLDCTVHGFRASFGDWADSTGVDDRLSEIILAHVDDSSKRAYKRNAPIERIRPVMQAWSDGIS